ncbi:MAG: ATP-binding cassette domain-containing protein [Treponema sp.]|nr:ATP-binding cassette domain-containing protein [Treponema sp.]
MRVENLVLRHVCFTGNGNSPLQELNLSIFSGDILGLITLDNQGLETLISLIMKNHILDRGSIYYRGKEVSNSIFCNHEPNKIVLVDSSSKLIPALNISDNFFFIKSHCPLFVKRLKQKTQIQHIFSQYGLVFNGNEYPSTLSKLERCEVEIIKAVTLGVKVIILRDPSSFLAPKEVAQLHVLIKKIAKESSVSFLYLCNHHQEILLYCTRLAIMSYGTIVLEKNCTDVTEEMMSIVCQDAIKSMIGLPKMRLFRTPETVVKINNTYGTTIDVNKGECVVVLDLDNKVIPVIKSTLFSSENTEYSIKIYGEDAYKNRSSWSFLPLNASVTSLCYSMSYVDNLLLKKWNSSYSNFWRKKKYRKAIATEYRHICGEVIDAPDLYRLTADELIQLLYQRILLEKPKAVFLVQPFYRMDMYQRVKILEYISLLQKQGIAVVILAISLSDSLQVASRLVIMQNHSILDVFNGDEFEKASKYGLVLK